jgi:DNA polymerase-3 subunit epsilon
MTKTIVAFDLETTGLDVQNDHIIQLGLVRFDSETFEERAAKSWYIKPTVDFKMSPEAQEKTGLTKEFIIENGVLLADIWQEALDFIGTDDMLSYNGNHFDVPMLYYNLIRYGLNFDFSNRTFYDSLIIERKRNSNKLADVYRRYTGKELEGAHDALCDVRGLIEIFKHQNSIKDGIEDPEFNLVSPEGFLKRNDKDELLFATGKYKDKTTNEICMKDPTYIKWVLEKFSKITGDSIKEAWYKEHPKNN